jgi:hypothetical protein
MGARKGRSAQLSHVGRRRLIRLTAVHGFPWALRARSQVADRGVGHKQKISSGDIMKIIGTIGLAAALCLVAGAAGWTQENYLSGEQISEHIRNTTQRGGNDRGFRFAVFRTADGQQKIAWTSGARSGIDRGKWRIDGDKLCSSFNSIRNGLETCIRIAKKGDAFITVDEHGKVDTTYTLEQGDTTDRSP